MRVGEILEYRAGRAARVARPYSPTGELDFARARRRGGSPTWREAQWVSKLGWRFPLFGAGFRRRPFDQVID